MLHKGEEIGLSVVMGIYDVTSCCKVHAISSNSANWTKYYYSFLQTLLSLT